jgi:hypothetical protein
VFTAIVEHDSGPGDQVNDCSRDVHLTRPRASLNAGRRMHGDAADVIPAKFNLRGVQADARRPVGMAEPVQEVGIAERNRLQQPRQSVRAFLELSSSAGAAQLPSAPASEDSPRTRH